VTPRDDASSTHSRRYLTRAIERASNLPAGSVITIPNAIPDLPVHAVELAVPRPVVGAAGRFDPSKGFDVLIRSVALAPEVNLVLAGEGECEGALRSLATDLGVDDRVHFIGWREDARSVVAAFDVLAVPSRAEAFGLVALEAMFAARPVIASDVGGLPEVVEDSSTGLLVPPDDPEALASALRVLVTDEARRTRLGTAGRARAIEHFSVDEMARSYEALYDHVMECNRS
jgi:glycosyltransferase involved in cell wall biosynthesis